jgi:hypothetical protein
MSNIFEEKGKKQMSLVPPTSADDTSSNISEDLSSNAPSSRSSTPIGDSSSKMSRSSSAASSRSSTPVEGSSSKGSRSSSTDHFSESSIKPAPRHKDLNKFLGLTMKNIEEEEEEAAAREEETPLLSESDSRSSTLELS